MRRPRLIDLFCGAGGAAVGYHRAGFDVVGVDIEPQPHYPYEFVQMDALEFMDRLLAGETVAGWRLNDFDAIHASPPCQAYSRMNHVHKRTHPELVEPTRDLFAVIDRPYVIENVEGAPLHSPVRLCGTSFGLRVIRHRLFEATFHIPDSECGSHEGEIYSPAGHGDPNWRNRDRNPHLRGVGYTDRCRAAMGIDWMNRDELAESIPPAYTAYVGRHLLHHLEGEEV